ncbi:MAG: hypothetical protein ABIV48_11145, partial [Pyrinomonadaceae bacterium]
MPNKLTRSVLATIITALAVIVLSYGSFSQEVKVKPPPPDRSLQQKEYQNLQRARRLILLKNEVKALDIASIRCFARLEIVKFIYENDVRAEFDSADSMSLKFFEDMAKNPDQITPSSAERWGNFLLPLLRKKSPDLAKKVEKQYMARSDTSVSDLMELDAGRNPREIANRTIAKIEKGDVSDYVLTIHDKIRSLDPAFADLILAALMSHWERTPDLFSRFGPFVDFIGINYTRDSAPIDLKIRYCRFIVGRGLSLIAGSDNGPTSRFILRTLKGILPTIEKTIPDLFPEARSIALVLDSRLNKDNREREKAYARIEA